MRKTKQVLDLEKELASARLQAGIANGEKSRFEAEAVRLQRALTHAEDKIRVLWALLRILTLGCKFQETGDRPNDVYGAYPP